MDETNDQSLHLAILNPGSMPCTLLKGNFWFHGMDEQTHGTAHPINEIIQGITIGCSPCKAAEIPDVDGAAVLNRGEQNNRDSDCGMSFRSQKGLKRCRAPLPLLLLLLPFLLTFRLLRKVALLISTTKIRTPLVERSMSSQDEQV